MQRSGQHIGVTRIGVIQQYRRPSREQSRRRESRAVFHDEDSRGGRRLHSNARFRGYGAPAPDGLVRKIACARSGAGTSATAHTTRIKASSRVTIIGGSLHVDIRHPLRSAAALGQVTYDHPRSLAFLLTGRRGSRHMRRPARASAQSARSNASAVAVPLVAATNLRARSRISERS